MGHETLKREASYPNTHKGLHQDDVKC
jgi:hypothetical protein